MTIDNRTPNLNLPLPHEDNDFEADVQRLRDALTALDTAVNGRALVADITAAIAALVAGAPTNLNTLAELAASIGNDPNFTSTVATALSGKANAAHTHAIADITGLALALAAKLESVPTASASVLGVVKVGTGLTIDVGGVLSLAGGSISQAYSDSYITPTAGQTVFTVAGGYIPGQLDVILNGSLLYDGGDDYVATNGTSFTLAVGASTSDTIKLRKWQAFSSVLIGTAAAKDVAPSGNASASQVVLGNDTRLDGLTDVPVTGTTQSVSAGNNYVLNGAACACTLTGTQVAGQRLMVTSANGLQTNSVDFGSKTVRGSAGTTTGIVTLNLGVVTEFRAIDANNWVIL